MTRKLVIIADTANLLVLDHAIWSTRKWVSASWCRTPLHALQIFSAFCLSNCQHRVTGKASVCSHQHDCDILFLVGKVPWIMLSLHTILFRECICRSEYSVGEIAHQTWRCEIRAEIVTSYQFALQYEVSEFSASSQVVCVWEFSFGCISWRSFNVRRSTYQTRGRAWRLAEDGNALKLNEYEKLCLHSHLQAFQFLE